MPNARLVAVDTNVALDFAKGIDDVCDAIATIRARISGVELWVSKELEEFDLVAPVIATLRELVRKFFH